jgi:mono/diheme cytochrome c family protein
MTNMNGKGLTQNRTGTRWLAAASLGLVALGIGLALNAADAAKEPKLGDASKLPPASTNKVDFAKEIQPIFKKSCLDCHGEDAQMGDYRMDKREAAIKGGASGPAIIPGKSEKSALIHYVARLVKGLEMPPDEGDRLTKEQVSLLRAWIDQGAKW